MRVEKKSVNRERPLGVALVCGVLLSFVGACGDDSQKGGQGSQEQTINPYPNFRGGDASGEKNFAVLINEFARSKSTKTPWAGFWWPYTKNGIAVGTGGGSPAGKYDAARGGTSRSQTWEARHHGAGVPGVQGWWGHCNGWCVAAALFDEPRESKNVNGVTFGVADQKALLTEVGMEASADFYGDRVDWGRDYNSPKIDDPCPNQFFLVLTNYMGKLRQPVLLDRFTGSEVWNHPVAGYEFQYPKPSDYLGATPEAPNIYRITMTARIWWTNDGVAPDVITPDFDFNADGYYFQDRELPLEIWVDAPIVFDAQGKIVSSGNIVISRQGDHLLGGAWLGVSNHSSQGHPDYLWVPYSVLKPTDYENAYANPELDLGWIQEFVLQGKDDPRFTGRPPEPPPVPRPEPSDRPTGVPTPLPTSTPTGVPTPLPTLTPSPIPTVPTPRPTPPRPTPLPTSTPTVTPVPTSTPTGAPNPVPTSTPAPTPTSTPSRGLGLEGG